MSSVATAGTLPPLGRRLKTRAPFHLMPALKAPAVARDLDTRFKHQRIREEDMQLLLKFLRETCDLPPSTSPADTVCKLQHRMAAADSKIKQMKEKLLDHDVLLFAAQEALDLGPEVNPVKVSRALKSHVKTSRDLISRLEKTIKGNDALLQVCKEIAGVSGYHAPEGLANFFRSSWSRKQHSLARMQETIQNLKDKNNVPSQKDSAVQPNESLMELARAMGVDTSDGQVSSVVASLKVTFEALQADITSRDDVIKTKDDLIKDLRDGERAKNEQLADLKVTITDLTTKNQDLTRDLKESRGKLLAADNRAFDRENKCSDLELTNDKLTCEMEDLLQRYEQASQMVEDLRGELDESQQKDQKLMTENKSLLESYSQADHLVSKLQTKVANLRHEKETLDSELKKISDEHRKSQALVVKRETELAELQEEKKELDVKFLNLEEKNGKVMGLISNLQKEISDIRQIKLEKETELKDLRLQNERSEKLVTELRDDVANLQRENHSLESHLVSVISQYRVSHTLIDQCAIETARWEKLTKELIHQLKISEEAKKCPSTDHASQISELQTQQEDLKSNLEDAETKLAASARQIEALQIDVSAKTIERNEISEQHQASCKELQEMELKLLAAMQRNEELQIQVANLERERNEVIQSEQRTRQEQQGLTEQLGNAARQNEDLKDAIASLEKDKAQISEQLGKSNTEIETLDERLKEAIRLCDDFDATVAGLKKDNDLMTKKLSKNDSELQDLMQQVSERTRQNKNLRASVASLSQEREHLSTQLCVTQAKVDMTEVKLRTSEELGEKLATQIKEKETALDHLGEQLKEEKETRLFVEGEVAVLTAEARDFRHEVTQLKVEIDGWKSEVDIKTKQCEEADEKVAMFKEMVDLLDMRTSHAEAREQQMAEELENMKASMTAAAIQFGLLSTVGETISAEGLCRSFDEMKQHCTAMQGELDDLKRTKALFDEMMKMCAPTIDSADINDDDEVDYEKKGMAMLKETIDALRFKTNRQELMIKKLRYQVTCFQKDVLEKRGSLYGDMTYIDRAVVQQFVSLAEVETIPRDDLSPYGQEPEDGEDEVPIGQGSFGKVFLKRYRGDVVAVKVPYDKFQDMGDDEVKRVCREKMNNARITMEAIVHGVLQDHPSFPKLFGVADAQGCPSLVVEFVGDLMTGTSFPLCQALQFQSQSVSKDGWFDIVLDIMRGMKALHDKGLLHNDLKANNVLMKWDDEVQRWRGVIIDMGKVSTIIVPIKHRAMAKDELEGYKTGTIYQHLAPEYILGQESTSIQTDIYALGKLLDLIARRIRDDVLRHLAAEMTASKPHLRPAWRHIEKTVHRARQKCHT